MNLQQRIDLLSRLGDYIVSKHPDWEKTKEKASQENGWFIPEFINQASSVIAKNYLGNEILNKLVHQYHVNTINPEPKIVGIVMAGNIPMVGFHDLLCVFITGHKAKIKLSSKDSTLIKHIVTKLAEWSESMPGENSEETPGLTTINELVMFEEMLKSCDAYIATGSNNSSRYFDYYFGKYAHIIRRNRSSAAILDGNETADELENLADDIHLYFGLGCRNVTKIYVPGNYDFIPLLSSFKKYNYFIDHHKYKNNYDYNLAMHILNNNLYMTNGSVILFESSSLFSPISQVNYEYYTDKKTLIKKLEESEDLQCIVGHGYIPFGKAQTPPLTDYPDGIDTMKFLVSL